MKTTHFFRFAATSLALFSLQSVSAQLAGELGILDLTANDGNNPSTGAPWAAGDQYRLVFVTSATTDATSSDIATYNTFVQGVADTAGIGGTWKIVGSTATIDARDNTGTNPTIETGVPVFLTDGATAIAINNEELWNGIDAPVNLDESGVLTETNVDRVYTGSDANGTGVASNGRYLGGDAEQKVRTGRADTANNNWMIDFNVTSEQQRRVFAMSDPLTVSTGPSSGLEITSIDYDAAANTVSLTWNSVPDLFYTVKFSTDMIDWSFDLDDGVVGDQGESTSRTFDLNDFPELDDITKVFFRIER